MNQEDIKRANRSAAIRWGGFVVVLLGLQVAGGAAAIYLATGDPSVAVVPDYHEKALHWDQEIARQRETANLNWNVRLDVAPGISGQSLVLRVSDAENQLIHIKQGELRIYHHARAGEVIRIGVKSAAAEPIVVKDCFHKVGLWQVELDVQDDQGNRFVKSYSVDVSDASKQPEAT